MGSGRSGDGAQSPCDSRGTRCRAARPISSRSSRVCLRICSALGSTERFARGVTLAAGLLAACAPARPAVRFFPSVPLIPLLLTTTGDAHTCRP